MGKVIDSKLYALILYNKNLATEEQTDTNTYKVALLQKKHCFSLQKKEKIMVIKYNKNLWIVAVPHLSTTVHNYILN